MKFLAVATRGLSQVLEQELKDLGITTEQVEESGVWFSGGWIDAYRVNLHSRIANRVVFPLGSFSCTNQDALYAAISELDFEPYLKASGKFLIDATVRDCGDLRDQRFVALKVKDAIADKFRDKFGQRPDIDKDDPDVRVIVRGFKGRFDVSIDTTGTPLFQRGYRLEAGQAPLKETLAAGLLALTGWQADRPLWDLMCGSGTMPIEAALKAMRIAPGTMRENFSFQNFENYESEAYEKLRDEAFEQELDECPVAIWGSDRAGQALKAAQRNAKRAGVLGSIEFHRVDVMRIADVIEERPEGAMLVANPPYGERMDHYDLVDTYRNLSYVLKNHFGGSEAWILSSSKEMIGELKLKSFQNYSVMNGPLDCRFLGYRLNKR